MRILLFTLLFLGCTKSTIDVSEEQFNNWKLQKISNYAFSLRVNCFCPLEAVGPHEVVVKNGQVSTVNGKTYDPQAHSMIKSIDDLFAFINESIARKPFKKTLEYDAKYYFPSNVFFDYSEMMADEELGYQVTNFKPL